MDSTAQTGHSGDLHEEMYQRLKYLKDTYFTDLREIHQKLSLKLSQLDNIVLPNARGGEQIEKMKNFKMVLERMMTVLQLPKSSMHLSMKDRLSLYEKQILNILHNHKKGPQQQSQAGQPSQQQHSRVEMALTGESTRRVRLHECKGCGSVHKKRRL